MRCRSALLWALPLLAGAVVGEMQPAHAKRVVPASFWLSIDENHPKAGSWWTALYTRGYAGRWIETHSNSDSPFYFRTVAKQARLNGKLGTLLRREDGSLEVFIPDLNSGSAWVSIRGIGDRWDTRWRRYTKASIRSDSGPAHQRALDTAVQAAAETTRQTQAANSVEFLEAIRDNRMSDVRRMLRQDRSLANATAKIKYGPFNEDKFTAMRAAMHFDRLEMGRLLLQNGASRRYLNAYLFSSVYNGKEEWVKMFVRAGANVNARNGDEGTLIFVAVSRANLKMARLLKSLGADLRAQNSQGYTPSEYATLLRNPVMADLLRPR